MSKRSFAAVVCAVTFAAASGPISAEEVTLGPGDLLALVSNFSFSEPAQLWALQTSLGTSFRIDVTLPNDTIDLAVHQNGDFFLATEAGNVFRLDPVSGAQTTFPDWNFGNSLIEDLDSHGGNVFVTSENPPEELDGAKIWKLGLSKGDRAVVMGGAFDERVKDIAILLSGKIFVALDPLGNDVPVEFKLLDPSDGSIATSHMWTIPQDPPTCDEFQDLTTDGEDAFALFSDEECPVPTEFAIQQLHPAMAMPPVDGTRTERSFSLAPNCLDADDLAIAPDGTEFVGLECEVQEVQGEVPTNFFRAYQIETDGALTQIPGSRFDFPLTIRDLEAVSFSLPVPEPSARLLALAALGTLTGLRIRTRARARPR